MSNDRKDYKLYLIDIKTSCLQILKYTKNTTRDQFIKNHMLVDAVERNIEIIGEAGNSTNNKGIVSRSFLEICNRYEK